MRVLRATRAGRYRRRGRRRERAFPCQVGKPAPLLISIIDLFSFRGPLENYFMLNREAVFE